MSTPADRRTSGHTNRRDFLKIGSAAVGALVIGIPTAMAAPLRRLDENGVATDAPHPAAHNADVTLAPNEYLRIDADGAVSITVARSEMGQGVRTTLPMILADELGADWSRITLVQASPSPTFKNLSTGGSTSVSDMYQPLRRAGAAAREMLITAAATQLAVPTSELRTADGMVTHSASNRQLTFASLVSAASKLAVPQNPLLKEPDEFQFIGKARRRIDGPAIVTGKATYGLDVRVPDMLVAAMAMPPVPGGKVASHNRAAALAVNGVRQVIELPRGVAVVADNTWAAFKGRTALAVTWNDGEHVTFDSTSYRAKLRTTASAPGAITARTAGDVEKALVSTAKHVSATYESPFQAHATMEPQNCTARVTANGCDIWVGTQEPADVQQTVAKTLGLRPEQVNVNVTLLGGSFGRRIVCEYASDAALLAKQVAKPVQLVWSRPDDMGHDMYQPMFVAKLDASLDATGRPTAFRHRIASPAVTADFGGVAMEAETLGARDFPYASPNVRIEYTHVPAPMKMGWWRAIQFVPNIFARESFIDEMAAVSKTDPLEYRLQLLNEQSQADFLVVPVGKKPPERVNIDRLREVLLLAASKAGWNVPLAKGHGRGIACLSYDDRSYIAQVVDVEVSKAGALRINKVTTALDAGLVINPIGITAQVESGIVWALTNALYGDMRFERGRAARTTFGQYRVAAMRDMPVIETHLIPGKFAPSGAGEPPVPAVAAAIGNAVYSATGKRIRTLPFPTSLL